ncbi:MAG: ATP-binding protein [Candidatus Riflebacteria bacterium]|nr:ATP-binding protein [Candidatus Riflebacteria bacterium]
MPTADQLKALVRSFCDKDDAQFFAIALQMAAAEARKGHHELAGELKALIDKGKVHSASFISSRNPISIVTPRGELADLLNVSHPETRLSEMILTKELCKRIERIISEQRQINKLKGHNLYPRQKLLLTGAPGCGKTMTASVLAGELRLPLMVVRLEGLITKYLGESASKLRLIFDAIEKTRAVYLFDEFDSIGFERGSGLDVGEIRRILNSFLTFMEYQAGNSLLVAATNCAQNLDSALFRRFDDLLEFEKPQSQLIIETFKRRLCLVPGKENLDFKKIALEAKGMSFAEIIKTCDEAIKEMILGDKTEINTGNLVKALRERRAFLKGRE